MNVWENPAVEHYISYRESGSPAVSRLRQGRNRSSHRSRIREEAVCYLVMDDVVCTLRIIRAFRCQQLLPERNRVGTGGNHSSLDEWLRGFLQ